MNKIITESRRGRAYGHQKSNVVKSSRAKTKSGLGIPLNMRWLLSFKNGDKKLGVHFSSTIDRETTAVRVQCFAFVVTFTIDYLSFK